MEIQHENLGFYRMEKEHQSRIVVAAVIFPANLDFFEDFLQSMNCQTEKNFDLVLFNDGCDYSELKRYLKPFEGLRYRIVDATKKNPSEIRVELIEYLKSEDYEIIVFADTDDYFSENRVALSLKEIEDNADIVVNDLSLVSREGKLIQDRVWKRRLPNLKLDLDFLLAQNVLGLGNTAIRAKLLQFEVEVDGSINFFDWIFYLQVFFNAKNLKCAVIGATTFYRQHELNTLGLGAEITRDRLEKLWNIRGRIYSFAQKLNIPNIESHLANHSAFKKEVLDDEQRLKNYILKVNNIENLFWFEEINLNNERNTTRF